jgi:hypothetical protein
LKPWPTISHPKTELDRVRQARRSLEKARLKLLSPSIRSMDNTASDLAMAVECLRKLESALASGPPWAPEWRRSLAAEMGNLRRDLKEVYNLLANVGKFYQGWARLVSAGADDAPANYNARGTQSPASAHQSSKVVAIG